MSTELVDILIDHLRKSLSVAHVIEEPFKVLNFKPFPNQLYPIILRSLPEKYIQNTQTGGYDRDNRLTFSLDRVHELGIEKHELWEIIRQAFTDTSVISVLGDLLDFDSDSVFPFVALTRDINDWEIPLHPDAEIKHATLQCYLARDDSNVDMGTILFDENKRPVRRLNFAPTETSFHAVSPIGDRTRDSLMVFYNKRPFQEY